jgi:hypothetical protein
VASKLNGKLLVVDVPLEVFLLIGVDQRIDIIELDLVLTRQPEHFLVEIEVARNAVKGWWFIGVT